MKGKITKAFAIALVAIIAVSVLSACAGSGGGIKDGTYVDAITGLSYTFKGDKVISTVSTGGVSISDEMKYSYKNGVLSYWQVSNPQYVISFDCDYDGDSITIYAVGRKIGDVEVAGVKYVRQ